MNDVTTWSTCVATQSIARFPNDRGKDDGWIAKLATIRSNSIALACNIGPRCHLVLFFFWSDLGTDVTLCFAMKSRAVITSAMASVVFSTTKVFSSKHHFGQPSWNSVPTCPGINDEVATEGQATSSKPPKIHWQQKSHLTNFASCGTTFCGGSSRTTYWSNFTTKVCENDLLRWKLLVGLFMCCHSKAKL